MPASTLLLTIVLQGGDPVLRLAQSQDVVQAVASCDRATGAGKLDVAVLDRDGWQVQKAESGPTIAILRREGTSAVILHSVGKAAFNKACMVRARVADRSALQAIADQITADFGAPPRTRPARPESWTWWKERRVIGMSPFDGGGDGTYVTQIVVGSFGCSE